MNHSISPPPLRRQGQEFRTRTSLAVKPGALRIFAWNVNGIAPFVTPYLLQGRPKRDQHSIRSFFRTESPSLATIRKHGEPSLRRALERLGWPHILCLQEVKIKRGDERTMDTVRAAGGETLQDSGPVSDVHFNLPRDPHNVKGFGGKIYGVTTMVQRSFARAHIETVRDAAWDKEAEYKIIETRDLAFPHLNIASTPSSWPSSAFYAANGTSRPYRPAPPRRLRRRHVPRPETRAVHFELLLREAMRLEGRGFAVMVCRRRDDDRGGLVGFNGIDTFRSVHGGERRYSYYPRGRDWGSSCDRVDLIIAFRALGRLLLDAGICDNSRDRGPSDHCPVWAEFGR
ncbi:DNase I-like protein [Xylaria acuta]|nr:DNase I-like protein [Xylaria acuta]